MDRRWRIVMGFGGGLLLGGCAEDHDRGGPQITAGAEGTAGIGATAGQLEAAERGSGAAGLVPMAGEGPPTAGTAHFVDASVPSLEPDAGKAADATTALVDASSVDGSWNAVDASPDDAALRDAGPTQDAAADAATPISGSAGQGAEPSFDPVYRIALRVHRANSGLDEAHMLAVLEEVNWIWWSQAAVCFEIEVVDHEQPMDMGFDFWFHEDVIPCSPGANGVYCGPHDIHSLDDPNLGRTNNAEWDTEHDAARTTAHELGHGLGLGHYNGYADSNDSLMASGRQGFKLHDSEVEAARRRARSRALEDLTPLYCGAPALPEP